MSTVIMCSLRVTPNTSTGTGMAVSKPDGGTSPSAVRSRRASSPGSPLGAASAEAKKGTSAGLPVNEFSGDWARNTMTPWVSMTGAVVVVSSGAVDVDAWLVEGTACWVVSVAGTGEVVVATAP